MAWINIGVFIHVILFKSKHSSKHCNGKTMTLESDYARLELKKF